MTHTVTYHRNGYARAHPAINVKLRAPGWDFRSAAVDAGMGVLDADRIHKLAYERAMSDFWQAAQELADQYGVGTIYSEGRSGGWLVIDDDPTHGGEDDAPRDWLLGYDRLRRWATNEVGLAPVRVARLAQDMAMDELGARAVNRPMAG